MSANGHIPPGERHLMASDERARQRREDRIREEAEADAVARVERARAEAQAEAEKELERRVAAWEEQDAIVRERAHARERRRYDSLVQLPLVYGDFKGCVI